MLIAIALCAVLFGLCGSVHYFMMSRLLQHIKPSSYSHGMKMIIGLFGAGIAHVMEAGFYAVGFMLGDAAALGGFKGVELPLTFMDTFYFSLVNYTSLGLGDIYPTGHLRLIAGIESLNGFLLISCSAAFLFSVMPSPESNAA